MYCCFARWQTIGLLHRLNEASNHAERLAFGWPPPSLAPRVDRQWSLDAHKRVNGHKRQVLCDTGGRIWRVQAHAANGCDSRAARSMPLLATQLRPAWASRLRRVLTDTAYCGRCAHHVHALGWQQHVVSRPPSATRSSVPVAQRWVVERTFA